MKRSILKLKPHFEYRVWANENLKTIFNLDQDKIGEAWLISALENKSSIIINLDQPQSLLDFYNNPENAAFFDDYNLNNPYPMLAKIIDAKTDLSVQIHPDDQYAKQFNQLGKTECWYILDTKNNNEIVLGHNAKSLEAFKGAITNQQWDQLLKKQPIKKDDFIYVPAKKIHAIKADTLIYELQQSSDITYRVYDYDRLDNGQKRELHLDHVFNLIETPDQDLAPDQISNQNDYLVANQQFYLKVIDNDQTNQYQFKEARWIQLSVIEGTGKINNLDANKFDSFLIAHNTNLIIEGKCKCLISFIK